MTTYIANTNGDWWVHNGDPLIVLHSDNIPPEIDPEEIERDKFEYIIFKYGKSMELFPWIADKGKEEQA